MSVQLLDKTRRINKLLHNNTSSVFVFNDICKVMSDVLESNILVLSRKGKILGINNRADIEEITSLINNEVGLFVDGALNERFLNVLSTMENANLELFGFENEKKAGYNAMITPIDISGERLGTLFMYRINKDYVIDDIILCEYATTVVGLEMLRSVKEEEAETLNNIKKVRSAISTLSYSEVEAIRHVFAELNNDEGILVASKIADRVGITRSVIVNAIRKFESAGVIESHSSGMKGTYIKILNKEVFAELKKVK